MGNGLKQGLRLHLTFKQERPLLAEDCRVLAFTGSPENAEWLEGEAAEDLLKAVPDANIAPEQATQFLQKVVDGFEAIAPHLEQVAKDRGEALLEAHRRVRTQSGRKGLTYRVEPKLPPDVLGMYVYLPVPKG